MLRQLFRRVVPLPMRVVLRRRLIALLGVGAPPAEQPAGSGPSASSADTSQAGEAAELEALIVEGFPRTLVDVGAFDGVTISNSRPFTLRGWSGLLVEPHPGVYERLLRANQGMTNTTCVNVACSDSPGTLPLFLGRDDPESPTSTLCTDDNPWFRASRASDFVTVEVTTLTDLLTSNGWPHDFSMLLVDAEGMDYEVLNGLDFARFRPRIIVTEEYLFDAEKHRNKYRLLLDRGYTFYKMVGCNTLWIANEWVEACLGHTAGVQDGALLS